MRRKKLYILLGVVSILICASIIIPVTLHGLHKNKPVELPNQTILSAGLYDQENQLTTAWTDLVDQNLIEINGTTIVDCSRELSGSLVLDEGILKIGKNAFLSCQALTSVTLPASVTEIGLDAFYNCIGLEQVIVPEDSELVTIGYGAFTYCEKLKTFSIPASVTMIDESAFLGCTALNHITIPAAITTIEESLFKDCKSLSDITFTVSPVKIDSYAFYNCESLPMIDLTKVETIGNRAFFGCDALTSIRIPLSCKKIEQEAFYRCLGLEEILFDENDLTEERPLDSIVLEQGVFEECSSLKMVTLPSSITVISDYMFAGCESLESFSIGKFVTRIGRFAFQECDRLTISFLTKGYWVYNKENDFTNADDYTFINFWESEEDRRLLIDGLEDCYFGIVEEATSPEAPEGPEEV
ncbi:MAG: leucine-rich repeat domain-containing protein [Anaeroplasmataceae bacterium]|nr:leucine-rich repeat domain-containing protein [Anaeroplasmataceae bacterium]